MKMKNICYLISSLCLITLSARAWHNFPFPVEKNLQSKMIKINFDRLVIVGVEGMWARDKDSCTAKYPYFPQANPQPWPGQEEFLQKLEQIELKAENNKHFCWVLAYEYSVLQFDEKGDKRGTCLGTWKCYRDEAVTGIAWAESLGSHYIKQFNVKPSAQFYHFVMTYPL